MGLFNGSNNSDTVAMRHLKTQLANILSQLQQDNEQILELSDQYYQAIDQGNTTLAQQLESDLKDAKRRKKDRKKQQKQIEDAIQELEDLNENITDQTSEFTDSINKAFDDLNEAIQTIGIGQIKDSVEGSVESLYDAIKEVSNKIGLDDQEREDLTNAIYENTKALNDTAGRNILSVNEVSDELSALADAGMTNQETLGELAPLLAEGNKLLGLQGDQVADLATKFQDNPQVIEDMYNMMSNGALMDPEYKDYALQSYSDFADMMNDSSNALYEMVQKGADPKTMEAQLLAAESMMQKGSLGDVDLSELINSADSMSKPEFAELFGSRTAQSYQDSFASGDFSSLPQLIEEAYEFAKTNGNEEAFRQAYGDMFDYEALRNATVTPEQLVQDYQKYYETYTSADGSSMDQLAQQYHQSPIEDFKNWFTSLPIFQEISTVLGDLDLNLAELVGYGTLAVKFFPGLTGAITGGFSRLGGLLSGGFSSLTGVFSGLFSGITGGISGLGTILTRVAPWLSLGSAAVQGGVGLYDAVTGEDTETKSKGAASATYHLGGAALGAAIGSVVPGVGTLIGAGVGAGVGGLANWVGNSWLADKFSGLLGDDTSNEEQMSTQAASSLLGSGIADEQVNSNLDLSNNQLSTGVLDGQAIPVTLEQPLSTPVVMSYYKDTEESNLLLSLQNIEAILTNWYDNWLYGERARASTDSAYAIFNDGMVADGTSLATSTTTTSEELSTNTQESTSTESTNNTSNKKTNTSNKKNKLPSVTDIPSITDTLDSISRNSGSTIAPGFEGSHKNGLDYVPHDEYRALLHKGEAVLTSDENKIWQITKNILTGVQKDDSLVDRLFNNLPINILKESVKSSRFLNKDITKVRSLNTSQLTELMSNKLEHSFAKGIKVVPDNNYPSILHKGEAVLTTSDYKVYTKAKELREAIQSNSKNSLTLLDKIATEEILKEAASNYTEFEQTVRALGQQTTTASGSSNLVTGANGDFLGRYGCAFETGADSKTPPDPGMVSTLSGDSGGTSYGVYMMATNGSAPYFGKWLVQNDPQIGPMFKGKTAGTTAFNNAWKQAYSQYPDQFLSDQVKFFASDGQAYQAWVKGLRNECGMNSEENRGYQEEICSLAAHNGPGGKDRRYKLVGKFWKQGHRGEQLIDDIMEARINQWVNGSNTGQYGSKPALNRWGPNSDERVTMKKLLSQPAIAYEQGTPWVPDDQIALLHKGEMVVPKENNPLNVGVKAEASKTESFDTASDINNSIKELKQIIDTLRDGFQFIGKKIDGKDTTPVVNVVSKNNSVTSLKERYYVNQI